MHEATISYLLPVLLSKVRAQGMNFASQSPLDNHERESRFLSLKIITDILTCLLAEESIYIQHSALDQPIQQSGDADNQRNPS